MTEDNLKKHLGEQWFNILKSEFSKDYFIKLMSFLKKEYQTKKIQPSANNIFRAFRECNYNSLKVVIVSQEPYPNDSANGVAFGTDQDKVPDSLKIFGKKCMTLNSIKRDKQLTYLSKQGVLLLNRRLTVEQDKPNSHQDKGWELFTVAVMNKILEKRDVPFLCFGKDAQDIVNKCSMFPYNSIKLFAEYPSSIHNNRIWVDNTVLERANDFLIKYNKTPIIW